MTNDEHAIKYVDGVYQCANPGCPLAVEETGLSTLSPCLYGSESGSK